MARHARAFAVIGLLLTLCCAPSLIAQPKSPFVVGVNYPWIAYGHDFGKNEWGHDGLITGGWTYQTYVDSQGFTDARFSKAKAHSGTGSLGVTSALVGQHPNKAKGEIYIDLRSHAPYGVSAPIDVTAATVSCWLFLPRESSGKSDAHNGVQFFFKNGNDLDSLYTPYQNIQPDDEERWVRFTAEASGPPAFRSPQYDPKKVVAVGLKISINGASSETLAGSIFVDDYVLSSAPAVTFDFEKLEVQNDFSALQQALGRCSAPAVRVFVFADGRAAPEFAADDRVTGLDEYVFQDFDALLDAAKQSGLLVIPVLLDFHWFDARDNNGDPNGPQLGGRSSIARDADRRQAFLEKAVKPLVARYSDNAQILAWEVINEPEWAIKEVPADFKTTDPVSLAEMQELVRLCAETIHANARQKVTVGSARRMWLQYWRGAGLDLYQFHWYEHFAAEEPFPWQPYSQLALDQPALVGEVPTANSGHSAGDYLLAAAAGGYQGLLLWSYRSRSDVSEFANARSMLAAWCGRRRRAVRGF